MTHRYTVGIDEVGRGPLAGPVTVGAVAYLTKHKKHADTFLRGIKDSKKLSLKQRQAWRKKFLAVRPPIGGRTAFNLIYAVASVGPATIDHIGISSSATLAVERCLLHLEAKLPSEISHSNFNILLDGSLYAPSRYTNQQTIIKGDEKIPIIAAASIVAKINRDSKMARFHKKYPHYGFDAHKGYGTAKHINAIRKNGLCDIHRHTFCSRIV